MNLYNEKNFFSHSNSLLKTKKVIIKISIIKNFQLL